MLHYSLNGDDRNVFVFPAGASTVAADGRQIWLQFVCQQCFNTAALMVFNEVKSYECSFSCCCLIDLHLLFKNFSHEHHKMKTCTLSFIITDFISLYNM